MNAPMRSSMDRETMQLFGKSIVRESITPGSPTDTSFSASSRDVAPMSISSIWPASMIVGAPDGFTTAMLLPATSFETSANPRASSRQTLAGADSKPDGPGVSSSRLRKPMEDSVSMRAYIGGMTMLYI